MSARKWESAVRLLALMEAIAVCGWLGCGNDSPTSDQNARERNVSASPLDAEEDSQNERERAAPLDAEDSQSEGVVWRTPSGPEHVMLLIPDGLFPMGSDQGDPQERPVHLVHLDSYYIDQYEVTLGQYRACVDAGACGEPVEAGKCAWSRAADEEEPINCMTWYNARDYCQWVGLRLPSEAEWEKAARGTDGRTYPWGEEVDRSRANYKGGHGRGLAVGSYPGGVSPYGVYEMGGNVWEWVEDWYDANYYLGSPRENPPGPPQGTHRVVRGGSWCFLSRAMRSAHREPYDPVITDTDIGFRCVRDAE